MFSRCPVCSSPLIANHAIERVPYGQRLAFDPARGRLWVICDRCAQWLLAPIEARWEALEDLERLCRDRARLLIQGENVALFRYDSVQLVRIGSTHRREEAFWRYGQILRRRKRRQRLVSAAGTTAAVGLVGGAVAVMAAVPAIPFLLFRFTLHRWFDPSGINPAALLWYRTCEFVQYGGLLATAIDARLTYTQRLWRGRAPCPQCGSVKRSLDFPDAYRLVMPRGEVGPGLRAQCDHCPPSDLDSGYRIPDDGSTHLLRRALAFHNHAGANERVLDIATRMLDTRWTATRWEERYEFDVPFLTVLRPEDSIALEMAVNEDVEKELLAMDLAEIQARWRIEEEIAAISDGELT